jgi:hypothetical protein
LGVAAQQRSGRAYIDRCRSDGWVWDGAGFEGEKKKKKKKEERRGKRRGRGARRKIKKSNKNVRGRKKNSGQFSGQRIQRLRIKI